MTRTAFSIFMQVLGYGRVSKLDYGRKVSDEELDTAAKQQRSRLERAGCTEIFFDIQRGTDDDRPNFERLIARRQKREQFDRIVITRDDGLGDLSKTNYPLSSASLSQLEIAP
ncbi:recombinase family protein [Leptolyngbya sp. AN03gr2]|uniref:recombinase family protein n=1 Tax=unclassified Leptolyngbya TaxID=2650499 RepID=UPI003D3235B9